MAIADAAGPCLAIYIDAASPHEVTLVHKTLASRHVSSKPAKLIGDKAYDSDPLDAELAQQGVELIAPHRRNRKKPKTQDGRRFRRYKRRWKIERLFAHLEPVSKPSETPRHKANHGDVDERLRGLG